MKKNIFIISGPSGAGEDSVIDGLEKILPIERIVTTTTREMRKNEKQGSPYYFISKEEFKDKILKKNFVEYAQHYNGNFYGVVKEELERFEKTDKIGIWKIDYKGVISAKNKFPEIKAIFLMAESLKILDQRIRNRDNVSQQHVKERMEYTKEWLKHENIYDFKVINKEGKLKEAVEEVANIIIEDLKKNE
jgi:guanylate kinase